MSDQCKLAATRAWMVGFFGGMIAAGFTVKDWYGIPAILVILASFLIACWWASKAEAKA